jgi:hypothetical protein
MFFNLRPNHRGALNLTGPNLGLIQVVTAAGRRQCKEQTIVVLGASPPST